MLEPSRSVPCTPAEVARAYRQALVSQRIRRYDRKKRQSYDQALPEALADLMQAPVAAHDPHAFYVGLHRGVVVPEARGLICLEQQSPLRDALGIRDRSALLPFAATLLFLRETRTESASHPAEETEGGARNAAGGPSNMAEHFARCWGALDPSLRADIEAARRRQLKRLRFHLMVSPDLRFLASARLQAADHAAPDPSGHGAPRIGTSGYSHFGREIGLFALLDELYRGTLLAELARPADEPPNRQDLAPGYRAANLAAVFDYVLIPLSVDLQYIVLRGWLRDPDFARTDHGQKGGQDFDRVEASVHGINLRSDITQAAVDAVAATLDRLLEQLATEDVSLDRLLENIRDACKDNEFVLEAAAPVLESRLQAIAAWLAQQGLTGAHKRFVTQGLESFHRQGDRATAASTARGISKQDKQDREARRTSQPLLEADPTVQGLYAAACRVLRAAQKHPRMFRSPDGAAASFAEMLALHFAFQLLSMLTERRYGTRDRPSLVRDLGRAIGTCHDPDTGHALTVLGALQRDKQLFGENFVKARNDFIVATLQPTDLSPPANAKADVIGDLLRPLEFYAALLGPLPPSTEPMIAIAGWALEAQHRIESQEAPDIALLTAREALVRTLRGMLDANRRESIDAGLCAIAPILGPPDRLGDGSRNELQALRAGLVEKWTEIYRRRQPGRPESDPFVRPELRRAWFASIGVRDLIDRELQHPEPPQPAIDVDDVCRFFAMKYAENQSKQERWLYVAYKIARTDGFTQYRSLFERLSRAVGEWRPRRIVLADLYQTLLDRDDFNRWVREPLESLFSDIGGES